MGPTWVLSDPDGPHVGPMNLAIRDPNHWGKPVKWGKSWPNWPLRAAGDRKAWETPPKSSHRTKRKKSSDRALPFRCTLSSSYIWWLLITPVAAAQPYHASKDACSSCTRHDTKWHVCRSGAGRPRAPCWCHFLPFRATTTLRNLCGSNGGRCWGIAAFWWRCLTHCGTTPIARGRGFSHERPSALCSKYDDLIQGWFSVCAQSMRDGVTL